MQERIQQKLKKDILILQEQKKVKKKKNLSAKQSPMFMAASVKNHLKYKVHDLVSTFLA